MSKYACLCGIKFNNKKNCDAHLINMDFENWEGLIRHKIFKQHWQARFLDIFFNINFKRHFKLTGFIIIYFTLIHHFKIDLNLIEAALIGAGIALIID